MDIDDNGNNDYGHEDADMEGSSDNDAGWALDDDAGDDVDYT